MGYIKAECILPKHLLEDIQKHIDGEYIYIPRKACNRKAWGEVKKSRQNFQKRNNEIYRKYNSGISVIQLAKMYYLSEKTIYKIIIKLKSK